jgi:ATP-dependent helicase/nuclease subunit A
MPVLSGLGAPPAVTEDAEALYRAAARATLRALDDTGIGTHLAIVLAHLDNRQQRLEDLLLRMLARRDQWLGHAIECPDGAALDGALRAAVEDELEALRGACPPDWLHGLLVVAGSAATALGRPALDAPGTTWEDLADWQWLAGLLLTRAGEPKRAWNARDGFPAPSDKGIDAATKAGRKASKDEIAALAERLGASAPLLARWRTLTELPPRGLDRASGACSAACCRSCCTRPPNSSSSSATRDGSISPRSSCARYRH